MGHFSYSRILAFQAFALGLPSPNQLESTGSGGRFRLGGAFDLYLALDDVPDQMSRAVSERQLVRKAACQQQADTVVTCHVCRLDQNYIFAYAEVVEVVGLGQDVEAPGLRGLDLFEFYVSAPNHTRRYSAQAAKLSED